MFISFHSRETPIILVRTFITVEEVSGASKVKERMFITVDGSPKSGERINVLIDYNTSMGTILGISYPMSIPPKPPDRVTVSIISSHGDHC